MRKRAVMLRTAVTPCVQQSVSGLRLAQRSACPRHGHKALLYQPPTLLDPKPTLLVVSVVLGAPAVQLGAPCQVSWARQTLPCSEHVASQALWHGVIMY